MRVDLHTHSTASDGTVPPADLMRQASAAELDVIALTDHDTVAGWKPAIAALPAGLTLVRGAEVSCVWRPAGQARSISLHLLAYLFDPVEPQFAAALARVRESRLGRGEQITARLAADGIDISWPEVRALAGDAPVGRPHIARLLVARGVVPDVDAAFGAEWLGEKYRIEKADIEVFHALQLVQAAGGVTVFAHPKAEKRGRVVPDSLIGELAAAGLTGIEADHADHTTAHTARIRELAARHGLVVTGSSDYHGSIKKQGLGRYTTDPAEYQRLIAGATGCAPVIG